MISRSQIKLVNSLHLQKFRLSEGLFVAEGVKVVDELLNSSFQILHVFATKEWIAAGHLPQDRYLVDVVEVSEPELERISSLGSPNQVLAVAKIPAVLPVPDIRGEWVLLLDQIRDPGNFGTIIRTADWFGINRIVAAQKSVDVWNLKVVQASMGSVFRMPVHYVDVVKFLERSGKDVPVYGTLLDGEPLGSLDLNPGGIVVIGNESHGISAGVLPFISRRITIPAASRTVDGHAESLNASIATAILCYEIRRQHPD